MLSFVLDKRLVHSHPAMGCTWTQSDTMRFLFAQRPLSRIIMTPLAFLEIAMNLGTVAFYSGVLNAALDRRQRHVDVRLSHSTFIVL